MAHLNPVKCAQEQSDLQLWCFLYFSHPVANVCTLPLLGCQLNANAVN